MLGASSAAVGPSLDVDVHTQRHWHWRLVLLRRARTRHIRVFVVCAHMTAAETLEAVTLRVRGSALDGNEAADLTSLLVRPPPRPATAKCTGVA